ncbi:hypothetical protein PR003_g5858 [Phytophthora rubi]|uniref:RxLR effector protein n=1 Tax=Phytophthora rubi TaxID=129364 RepID=A0A6A4FID4_9STRA|nr:hypothetical protein PR003_g5858 [Phytophthora rubi]
MIIAGGLVLFAGGCSGHEDVDLNLCNLPEMRPRLPHNQSFRAAAHVSQIRRPASTPTASASPLSVAATQCRRHPVSPPPSAPPLSVSSQCLAAQCRQPVSRRSVPPPPSVSQFSVAATQCLAGIQCLAAQCRRSVSPPPVSPPPSRPTQCLDARRPASDSPLESQPVAACGLQSVRLLTKNI